MARDRVPLRTTSTLAAAVVWLVAVAALALLPPNPLLTYVVPIVIVTHMILAVRLARRDDA